MTKPRSLQLLLALVALSAACGCSALDNCPDAQADQTIDHGKTDKATLTYESAPWSGPLDAFPAKTLLTFEHGLGVTPLIVQSFLSFSSVGTNGMGGGDATENAGNQGRIECVDAHVIVLKNDTCERSFYVRVVATGAVPEDKSPDACQK